MEYKPKYIISDHLVSAIARIEAINAEIVHMSIVPAWEKKLRKEARIKSTHFSTRIEGNRLSMAQVAALAADEVVPGAPVREVREVQNYFKVLDFIETAGLKQRPLTHETILKIQYLTMDGILEGTLKGCYREQQNVIRDAATGAVSCMPPPWDEVQPLMEGLIGYINAPRGVHPVLLAAITHYEFVRIHPFMDGNGRVARALAMLILYSHGLDVRKLFSLEEYYDSDRSAYYGALEKADSSGGDLTQWLEYFCAGMVFELERVRVALRRFDKGLHAPMDLSSRQIAALSYIRKNGSLSNAGYRKKFRVSNKTAYADMQSMVEKRLLVCAGRGRSLKYILAPDT